MVPKCENFGLPLINHISVGDCGNRIFVLFILKTEADFRHFLFFTHAECALKKCATHAEHAVKNVLCMLSMR